MSLNPVEKLWTPQKVQLTVSGCLGPCDMHNVALLMSDRGQIWLGNLRERAEFEALLSGRMKSFRRAQKPIAKYSGASSIRTMGIEPK